MALSTNFEVSPYFDDYSELKDFYRVLFKPGVPVQTRELNQLQTILQQQIERFGDHIFQKGTVIDGCHITYHNIFPYVKIKDTSNSGAAIAVNELEGYYLKNSSNLQSYIVTSVAGFESQTPDLNTLYIRYINSGESGSETVYAANQVLTVFKPDNRIYDIDIDNGATGFSNSDSVVIVSAIAVQNSAGGTTFASGFFAGDFLSNGNGANVEIISVDTTTNTEVTILKIKPQNAHLIGGNTSNWSIYVDESVLDANTGEAASVVGLVGESASATLRTSSVGKVNRVTMASTGFGYYVLPYVSVRTSSANTLQLSTLSLTPENFLAQVTIAPTLTSPIGTGYGVTVSDGIIFQRGFFQRVEEQLIVAEKYSNTPDLKVVGFTTEEEVINSNIDESLLDNALGSPNETAPGADRLKLTPTLIVLDKEDMEGNTEFFSICEFSQGEPFKYNKQTQYNIIGQEMARRTYEESGDYVVDQFILNTKSITPFANEASQFIVSVDPGLAYIKGNRVETDRNYNYPVAKATSTVIANSATISLNYGSYIKVDDVGGLFDFDTAAQVTLYNTAKNYLTSSAGVAITPAGTSIGTARLRSMLRESGVQGAPNSVYKLYLFDIQMNAGRNFKDVKSVYYNGTQKGIADVVLVNSQCKLYDNNRTAVTYPSGVTALKNANSITYTYRTFNQTLTANTSGIIQKTLGLNETFTTIGVWSESERQRLQVVPLANVTATSNLAGSVVTSTTNTDVVGTATTFTTVVSPGDYVRFANSTANGYGRIQSITNNTFLSLAANASIAITGANVATYFPQFVPVNMIPTTRTVNVTANGSVLTINLGTPTNSATVAVAYDVRSANVQPVTKTVNRNCFVRLKLSNNAVTNAGPWCLGMADVFRMRGVYKGANNTFAAGDSGVLDVTNDFYIDHNQNESFYDTSYLYKKPKSRLALTTSDVLLVKLDVFSTATEGLKTLQSYPVNDTLDLASLTTSVNTLEIPEMYGTRDDYYDLRDQMDFRPVSANTANISSTLVNATINPVEPSASARFSLNDKKFPAPDTTLTATYEYYVPRTDRVIVNANGEIKVIQGESGKAAPPVGPADSLTINLLEIPAYPSVPFSLSSNAILISDTKVANEKYTNQRLENFRIKTPITPTGRLALQPKGYTMAHIGQLESRIADLEYYLSKVLSELQAQKPVNDSTGTTRTNYGYFSDSFDNSKNCDVQNPDFYASFSNGRLVPKINELNIEFKASSTETETGDIATIPFVEYTLISQLSATDGPVESVVPPANTSVETPNTTPTIPITPPANTTPTVPATTPTVPPANTASPTPTTPTTNTTVIVQTITSVTVYNKNTLVNSGGAVQETSEFFMSSTSGPVQMYFNFRDNDNAIEIFQSSIPNFSTAALTPVYTAQNAVALTDTDKATKAANMERHESFSPEGFLGSPAKYAVEDSGKITFTHNPTNGRYYKIVITKYRKSGQADNWKGKFIYRLYYPTDSNITVENTVTRPSSFVYNGIVNNLSPRAFTVQASLTYNYYGQSQYHFSDSQKFLITISGLKPNTIHTFLFDGVDKTSLCQQPGKVMGGGLRTDTSGKITFDFYYDAGIDEVTTDFQAFNRLAASTSGIKRFELRSTDSTSSGSGTIEIKSYVQDAINITPSAYTIDYGFLQFLPFF